MAIAFDASSEGSGDAVSSITISHTTSSGSNRIMWVGVWDQNNDTVTGVTYNGVSMTQANKIRVGTGGGAEYVYLYYLVAPSTGANNVVISRSVSTNSLHGRVITFTGASQTGIPDASNTGQSNSASSLAVSVTVVAANSWVVAMMRNTNAAVASSDSNFTMRLTSSSIMIADTNGAVSAGSYTGTFNNSGGGGRWGLCMASFAPAAASGPANVKTVNDLALASVKTVNDLAIASVKTIKGLA